MDKWINASCQSLIKYSREELEAYRLYTVVPRLLSFLNDLTNWYVRCNRDRMKGGRGDDDALTALCTLYQVLLNVTVLMAPLTPFITELMYRNLSRALPDGHEMKAASVHFVMIPEPDMSALDEGIIKAIERMQALVELGRLCREKKQVGTKMPLLSMKINNQKADFVKDMKTLEAYIKEELAVEVVEYTSDDSMVQYAGLLNFKSLGKKLGKDLKVVMEAAKKLTQEELKGFEANGEITIAGHKIGSEEMTLERKTKEATNENFVVIGDNETIVEMDFTPCARLVQISKCNEIKNRVQKLRKDAKLKQDDPVDMWAMVTPGAKGTGELQAALKEKRAYID